MEQTTKLHRGACSTETKEKIRQSLIGKPRSEKAKLAISKAGEKKWQDPEYRAMMIEARKGRVYGENHPMYGKKHTPESCKKMSESHIGLQAGEKHPMFGKHLSEEHKKMMSELYKGRKLPPEVIEKLSGANNPNYGKHRSEETKAKISAAQKGKKIPAEQVRRTLTRRIPSSLESKFEEIVNKYNLPYKFVGDGSFMLGNRNPDFININGDKIAVEVYARYYKLRRNETIDGWKEDRQRIFAEYGWSIIFFDETQVTESNVLKVLSA